jgi:hypothetical protein
VGKKGGPGPALAKERGKIEPEHLSGNLIVQLGMVTKELAARWVQETVLR